MELAITTASSAAAVREPGFSTDWRVLPWLVVQLVEDGTYAIDHASGVNILPAGSLWFIPAGCRHRHRVHGRAAVRTRWWHGEARVDRVGDAFAGFGAPRVIRPPARDRVARALNGWHALADAGDLSSCFRAQARLHDLLAALSSALAATLPAPRAAALLPVFHFIDAHLHLPLTRVELAARAGLAPSRFHELFLATVGMAPMTWVRRQRLARAAALLSGGALSLDEIAQRTGFCDAQHLNKRFRAYYGTTPGGFRRATPG